ncbi:MAG: YggS family pyridoxal phosphate-dependent enzyme [Lachnospiraceae bacterium]|nr:YggS family pyridoxal phosphate-dependent enzyme [Lachnospiraceae bacterium]MBP5668840.1 YggS family pyridoxal phosphate-dependent enzyme [Lachnospiraceae bacterium]
MIKENYFEVNEKVGKACDRAGRNRDCVTLIAVSKTKPLEDLREAYEAGARDFGENKVQELVDKIPQMPNDVRWHMIGHLQRNKVKYIVDKVYMIHGVDSLKLGEEISKEAVKHGVTVRILIEVNVAGEDTKYGVSPEEAPQLAIGLSKLPGISLQGLMTIAPYVTDPEENRLIFAKLRQLAVDISEKNIDNVSMNVLSMGMTGDYEVAVEEGATFVRVGTGIFGERNYEI